MKSEGKNRHRGNKLHLQAENGSDIGNTEEDEKNEKKVV